MDSVRSPSSITFCLCIQLLICLLVIQMFPAVSASTSLWGKRVEFTGKPGCLCQLHRVAVPPVEELTACVLLKRTKNPAWTGFDYKAPGGRQTELGLRGNSEQLNACLFGEEHRVKKELPVNQWHSVCLTWSSMSHTLRLYVNGTSHLNVSLESTLPRRLAQNGTLTLGASHYVEANGALQTETDKSLLGEIGLFRMWGREWSVEELQGQNCADGDIVSWDLQHWKNTCSLEPDSSLHCAWPSYKITIRWFMKHSSEHVNITSDDVMRNWMEKVFPQNISVHDIILSPCKAYDIPNKPPEVHMEEAQASRRITDSTYESCFIGDVYVTIEPADDVQLVQALISNKLSMPFPLNFSMLMADNSTLRIQPVESMPTGTKPPPGTDSPIPKIDTPGAQLSVKNVLANGDAPLKKPANTRDSTYSPATSTNMSTTSTPLNDNNDNSTSDSTYSPATSTNMSTTSTPLNDNNDNSTSAARQDTFFRVNVHLNMIGTSAKPKDIIAQWLNEKLKINDTMDVLNLKIDWSVKRYYRVMTSTETKRYECTFHIQAFMDPNVETEKLIYETLTTKYENDGIAIETINMTIKRIAPDSCPENTTGTIYGNYIWPESLPQEFQAMICVQSDPPGKRGYRLCELEADADTTRWAEPKMEECKPLITILDLGWINVTTDNAHDVLGIIQELVTVQIGNGSVSDGNLSASQLETVVDKLGDIVDVSTVTPTLGTDVINIIADILFSKSDIAPVANMVLNLTEKIGGRMDFPEESLEVSVPSMAFSMINTEADTFNGLTFGVMSSFSPGLSPVTFVNQNFESGPLPDTVACIALPAALQNFFPFGDINRTRLQFQFYGTQDLFKDPGLSTAENHWTLNTYVVSASVNDSNVIHLTEQKVVATLNLHTPAMENDILQCVFWDFQKNGGQGGWNSSGCETRYISPYQTSCHCDHLTHFGVLLDVSRTPIGKEDDQILTVISNLGCGVSSFFLGITLLSYIAFDKLRQDYPSKILLNLSAALLGLNMVYLLNSWLSSFYSYSLCIVTAASLHYFMLASFMWMGLEAMHMYFALVKVFNIYVHSYILKFCVLGWGIPLVIVSTVLAVNINAYGNVGLPDSQGPATGLQTSEAPFCWLQSTLFLYAAVLPFVGLILLCNIIVFIVVLVQIRRMRTKNKLSGDSQSSLLDFKAVASLTFLLGLTWPISFLAWGPARVPLLYVFAVLNTLQGFFIFMFHCLMKENVRRQWRTHLCCGRFRLSEYSDWSRSRSKEKQLVNSACMGSVNSIKKVSDSAKEPSANCHQRA